MYPSHRHAGRVLTSIDGIRRREEEKLPIVDVFVGGTSREVGFTGESARRVITVGDSRRDRLRNGGFMEADLADLTTCVNDDTVVAIMEGRDRADNKTLDWLTVFPLGDISLRC